MISTLIMVTHHQWFSSNDHYDYELIEQAEIMLYLRLMVGLCTNKVDDLIKSPANVAQRKW